MKFEVSKNNLGKYIFTTMTDRGSHTAAVYNVTERELLVTKTVEECGVYAPLYLPYDQYRNTDGTWVLSVSSLAEIGYAELGFAEAESLYSPRACAGCKYLTRELALPCAVNPLAYGHGCREYSK